MDILIFSNIVILVRALPCIGLYPVLVESVMEQLCQEYIIARELLYCFQISEMFGLGVTRFKILYNTTRTWK